MTERQQTMIEGMDMLLNKFNIYPDSYTFTVKEIIEYANEVYKEIESLDRN